MKITFFGTSHGYAEKNRFVSSTLIESGSHSYLIDAGAPVEALMVNYDKPVQDLRGIFITHMHEDHVGCLSNIVDPCMRYRYNDKVTCFMPEEQGLDSFLCWMEGMHNTRQQILDTMKFKVVTTGEIFKNEDIKVTAIPTKHLSNGKFPAFAYLIEENGKKVLFTGDMGIGFGDYPDIVGNREYDLIVCEMAHAQIKDVWEMISRSKTKKLIFNHYSEHYGMIDWQIYFPKFPFDVQFAQDGLVQII